MKSRKYDKELLQKAVSKSKSVAGVLRELGIKQAGGSQSWIKKRIDQEDIDITHFLGQASGKDSNHKGGRVRREPEQILTLRGMLDPYEKSYYLRNAMIEVGISYLCNECEITSEWNGKALVLQIDHINGHRNDNRKENLRFLCPNCHSQTDTFGRKKR